MSEKNNRELEFIISLLTRKIDGVGSSTKCLDYYDSIAFAKNLTELRRDILSFSDINPNAAFDLMYKFIKTENVSRKRCFENYGDVHGEYIQACDDLGHISILANKSMSTIVDVVYELITSDEYFLNDSIVFCFREALDDEGVALLKCRFLKSIADKRSSQGEISLYKIRMILRDIADCNNDLDEYILAGVFPKASYSYDDFPISDKLEIISRLIMCGRAKDALSWIESFGENERKSAFGSSILSYKIEALTALGMNEEAQNNRMLLLERDLEVKVFREALNNTPVDLQEKFKKRVVDIAVNYGSILKTLEFLSGARFYDECSRFVLDNFEQIDGTKYSIVRKAAGILEKNGCYLAAVLLHRKVATGLANKAVTKYYQPAAKSLCSCYALDSLIDDYGGFLQHDKFFEEFAAAHKKKSSFWKIYDGCKRMVK